MFPALGNHRLDTPCRNVHPALATDSCSGQQSVDHDSNLTLFKSTSLKQKAGQKLWPTLRKIQQFSSAANSVETRGQNKNNGTLKQVSKICRDDQRRMYESSSSSSSLCSSDSSSYSSSFEEEIDENESDKSKQMNYKSVQRKKNDFTSGEILTTSCRIHPKEEERSDYNQISLNVKNESIEFQADENTFYDCNSPGRMRADDQGKYYEHNEQPSEMNEEIFFSRSEMNIDKVEVDGDNKASLHRSEIDSHSNLSSNRSFNRISINADTLHSLSLKNECSNLEPLLSSCQLNSEEKSHQEGKIQGKCMLVISKSFIRINLHELTT